MRDAKIVGAFRNVDARLDQLEADNQHMTVALVRAHRTIDALSLCLAEELGVSEKRAQEYRERALAKRAEAQRAASAQPQTSGLVVPVSAGDAPESTETETGEARAA